MFEGEYIMAAVQEKIDTMSLKGAFQGITLSRYETGDLVVDVSFFNGLRSQLLITASGEVVKQMPAEEQNSKVTEETGAIDGSVDKQAYSIGDVLPNGWVAGPVSPTTGKPMAIEPVSGALEGYQTWYKGEEHAKTLRGQGYASARQPDENELNVLYNEVVKAGHNQNAQFNTSCFVSYGQYWSSKTKPYNPKSARTQYFDNGDEYGGFKGEASALVRCVSDAPDITLV